jgi:hypothetical protein
MFLLKAFQTCPRPRQEAKTLVNAGYPVFVLAWDRQCGFRCLEQVDGAVVRSVHHVNVQIPRSTLAGRIQPRILSSLQGSDFGALGERSVGLKDLLSQRQRRLFKDSTAQRLVADNLTSPVAVSGNQEVIHNCSDWTGFVLSLQRHFLIRLTDEAVKCGEKMT